MLKVTMQDIRKKDFFYEEAMKTLRTNLQFSGNDIKIIMLTSCYENEGKSDVALSLAQELGSIGKRVLLLDADIRKSAYQSRFKVDGAVTGLSQYLSGQVGGRGLIYATSFPNIHIIFAGPTAPNPSELLNEENFSTLLKEARDCYDYVLIDTPPIGNIIDAAVVAKECDGAILVVEADTVSYKVAQKAKSQIERSGCRMLGAVLNKVDTKKNKYYNKYYSKYYSK